METKIAILTPFFKKPYELFHIREVAKLTGISHTAVRNYLIRFVKDGFLKEVSSKPYAGYTADVDSERYLLLKQYYNLEKLQQTGILKKLEQEYSFPAIVLFGSYAKGTDDEKSDIDIAIISTVKKEINITSFTKELERPVNLIIFDKKAWNETKKKNPHLINSLCNGIVLSGQLEVL